MTSNKKIVTVIGATGAQGGSVVRHLLGDEQYTIRAVTRDINKPASLALAEQGVQVVQADINDFESLKRAFEGSYAVFAVTDFWSHFSKTKEVEDGKKIADAAKWAGVQHYIWSSENSPAKLSGGKITRVEHFDSKFEVEEYAQQIGEEYHFLNL